MIFGNKKSPYAGALTFAYMSPLERDRYEEQYRQQQSRPQQSVIDPQLAYKQKWAKENARRKADLAAEETAAAASYRSYPSGEFQKMDSLPPPPTTSFPTFPTNSGGYYSRGTGRIGGETETQLLQKKLDEQKMKYQLSMLPALAGIQSGILGKIGSKLGLDMSQYQPPSMLGGAGGQNLPWMNSTFAPTFPKALGYGGGSF